VRGSARSGKNWDTFIRWSPINDRQKFSKLTYCVAVENCRSLCSNCDAILTDIPILSPLPERHVRGKARSDNNWDTYLSGDAPLIARNSQNLWTLLNSVNVPQFEVQLWRHFDIYFNFVTSLRTPCSRQSSIEQKLGYVFIGRCAYERLKFSKCSTALMCRSLRSNCDAILTYISILSLPSERHVRGRAR